MLAMHIEFFLEEPSAEALLQGLLPKILPRSTSWNAIVFQGKSDLLTNLESRLKGYRHWIPDDWRIVVLVDEDREDCRALKARLEAIAQSAGFATKSEPQAGKFTVVNRIAVEEIEAWYFGDGRALSIAYPGVSPNLTNQARYRNPDEISGGTWEALERVLQRAGYYRGGLPKIEAARKMAAHMDPTRNISASFRCFVSGLAAF